MAQGSLLVLVAACVMGCGEPARQGLSVGGVEESHGVIFGDDLDERGIVDKVGGVSEAEMSAKLFECAVYLRSCTARLLECQDGEG